MTGLQALLAPVSGLKELKKALGTPPRDIKELKEAFVAAFGHPEPKDAVSEVVEKGADDQASSAQLTSQGSQATQDEAALPRGDKSLIKASNPQAQHLILDELTVNARLARRLSPAVACRYHALPVAEADGRITVAMADPDDTVAREAVVTALGAPSCVVGGDPVTIDALLAEVWPEVLKRSLRLLVCAHASPTDDVREPPLASTCTAPNAVRCKWPARADESNDEVLTFARALGGLLNAHVSYFSPLVGDDANCDGLAQVVGRNGYDLVVWGEPEQSFGQRLVDGPTYRKVTERVSTSLLVTRRPRWPFKRLLLVVQDEETDNVAVDWVVRLARPSGAAVTVLAVVPPLPAMYNRRARMQQGLDALLTTDTALGWQMRRVARWLVDWEVEGRLRLRQGALDHQIRREVAEGDHDLIAVAAKPYGLWRRWLLRDSVASLLRWADRPVLIAKPTTV
jgi:nucleotide-binding universal stress UspA family protein